MKCLLLVAFIGAATASVIVQPAQLAVASTGQSSQFRTQDNAGNYAFGYNEDHATGGTFRRESGNAAGQVVGSYGLRDIDGRVRTVNYIADDAGFRAAIATNEPGVEPKDPADATINKGAVIAPAQIVAAPAAPIAVAAPAPILAAPAPVQVAAPIVNYAQYAPQQVVQYAQPAVRYAQPLVAQQTVQYAQPAVQYAQPLLAARPATFTTTTTTNQIVPTAAIAAPAPLAAQQLALNTYAHPAAWGYTLGLPQTFGYTVLKKK